MDVRKIQCVSYLVMRYAETARQYGIPVEVNESLKRCDRQVYEVASVPQFDSGRYDVMGMKAAAATEALLDVIDDFSARVGTSFSLIQQKTGIVPAFICAAEIKKQGLLCSGDERLVISRYVPAKNI